MREGIKNILVWLGLIALLYLAFAPMYTGFLIFVAFVPLLYILDKFKGWKLFGILLSAFCIYTFMTLYGMTSETFFGIIIYSVLHWLPFVALLCMYKRVKSKTGKLWVYTYFIASYVIFEIITFNVDIFMPILSLSHTLGGTGSFFWWISITGHELLNVFILIINILIYEIVLNRKNTKVKFTLASLSSVVVCLGFLSFSQDRGTTKMNILAINPNESYSSNYYIENPQLPTKKLLHLTDSIYRNSKIKPDLILWPETSSLIGPYIDLVNRDPSNKLIQDWVDSNNTVLIYGSIGFSKSTASKSPLVSKHTNYDDYFKTHNMAFAVQPFKTTSQVSKSYFIPFEESIPYPNKLGWIQERFSPITGIPPLSTYKKNKPVKISGSKVGIMLCYDAINPRMYKELEKKTDYIICLANELWSKTYSLQKRYVNICSVYCLEYNTNMIRSSNGGFSGLITSKNERILSKSTTFFEYKPFKKKRNGGNIRDSIKLFTNLLGIFLLLLPLTKTLI